MKQEIFTIKTVDNKEVVGFQWLPDNSEPEMIMQIIHGMSEHALRYKEFAQFLTEHNFAVYSIDLRGHGKTAAKLENLGFFAPKDGWKLVLDDIQKLTDHIRQKFPNLPLHLLGHSMGSLFARAYITTDKVKELSSVILSGTSAEKGFLIKLGKAIALIQGLFKGKKAQSKLILAIAFAGFNSKFKPTKTPFDWLTRDDKIVWEYYNDPYCGWIPSNRFFYDMFDLIDYINKKENLLKIPKNLPILILGGTDDPVGKFGKGFNYIYELYKKLNLNVDILLYDKGRHEMLNEINRQQVFNDILNWIENIKNQ